VASAHQATRVARACAQSSCGFGRGKDERVKCGNRAPFGSRPFCATTARSVRAKTHAPTAVTGAYDTIELNRRLCAMYQLCLLRTTPCLGSLCHSSNLTCGTDMSVSEYTPHGSQDYLLVLFDTCPYPNLVRSSQHQKLNRYV
jgi:hypothetical protein